MRFPAASRLPIACTSITPGSAGTPPACSPRWEAVRDAWTTSMHWSARWSAMRGRATASSSCPTAALVVSRRSCSSACKASPPLDRLPARVQFLAAIAQGAAPAAVYDRARAGPGIPVSGAAACAAPGAAGNTERDRRGIAVLHRVVAWRLLRHLHGREARRQGGADQSGNRAAYRAKGLPRAAEKSPYRRGLRADERASRRMARAVCADDYARAL